MIPQSFVFNSFEVGVHTLGDFYQGNQMMLAYDMVDGVNIFCDIHV